MSKTRVAINGFGRIGRAFMRVAWGRDDMEVVAINDLGSPDNLAYLLEHDTVYRERLFHVNGVSNENGIGGTLVVKPNPHYFTPSQGAGKEIRIPIYAEKDPAKLPWKDVGVDVVVESTGFFTSYEGAYAHVKAGAKRVVISAPAKGTPMPGVESATVLMGVNEEKLGTCVVTSNASCTTNAASPLIAILDENFGIEKAILNTVHGYTASQSLVDGPKKDFREGRAAAQNIVPTSTGAAIAVTKAFTSLEGLFDGISIRVPVVAGSIVDVTFISKKETTAQEVNAVLKNAAAQPRWKGIFSVTEEPLVSSDILGAPFASIADLEMTRVVGGNLIKVLAWYDNEMGYTHTLVEHVAKLGKAAQ